MRILQPSEEFTTYLLLHWLLCAVTAGLSAPLTIQFVCSVLWDSSFMSGHSYLQGHQKHQFPCHVHVDPENRKVKEAYFASHHEFKHSSVLSGRLIITEPDYITVFKISQYRSQITTLFSKFPNIRQIWECKVAK